MNIYYNKNTNTYFLNSYIFIKYTANIGEKLTS